MTKHQQRLLAILFFKLVSHFNEHLSSGFLCCACCDRLAHIFEVHRDPVHLSVKLVIYSFLQLHYELWKHLHQSRQQFVAYHFSVNVLCCAHEHLVQTVKQNVS